MCMLRSKIVPNSFSFTIAFSCGRAKMVKKRNVWTRSFGRRKKVSVFKQIRTIIRILYSQTNGKKRCNKELEVAAVFYILCIFGGENFTLNGLYVAGKVPTYPSSMPTLILTSHLA